MGVRPIGLLALVAVLAGGCGADPAPPPSTPRSALQGAIEYSRTGGLAGVSERLTVQPDGAARARSRRAERSFRLTREERRTLVEAVDRARPDRAQSPPKGYGADAFEYAIAYRGHTVAWSDLTDGPAAPVAALSEILGGLYARHEPAG